MADRWKVQIYPDRAELGRAAAARVAGWMRGLLAAQPQVVMVFAAAPSQNEFLSELGCVEDLDWRRVVALHMDEYLGLPAGSAQSFGAFLKQRLFDPVRPGAVHYLAGDAVDAAAECRRYAALLAANPVDIVCAGIGENGHLAFNDPPVADFADPLPVKVVELDRPCREQQVHDGCFARLEEVPTHAMTLTIPALTRARRISCVVPGATKAAAVAAAVAGPIATACPASILRRHAGAVLSLDRAAAARLPVDLVERLSGGSEETLA